MLTAKQERFCQEMIKPKANQSDAYRAAFQAKNMLPATIHSEAYRLMQNPEITARIAELMAPAVQAARISHEQWLSKMQLLFEADVRKLFLPSGRPVELHELGEAEALLIEGFEVEEQVLQVGGKADRVVRTKKYKLTKSIARLIEFGKVMGWIQGPDTDSPPQDNRVLINYFTVTPEAAHSQTPANILNATNPGRTEEGDRGHPPFTQIHAPPGVVSGGPKHAAEPNFEFSATGAADPGAGSTVLVSGAGYTEESVTEQ